MSESLQFLRGSSRALTFNTWHTVALSSFPYTGVHIDTVSLVPICPCKTLQGTDTDFTSNLLLYIVFFLVGAVPRQIDAPNICRWFAIFLSRVFFFLLFSSFFRVFFVFF